MTPQETDPDFPASVQESLAEVCASGGLLQGQEHSVQQCTHGTYEGGPIIFITSTTVWPQVKQQGGNKAPTINRKLD